MLNEYCSDSLPRMVFSFLTKKLNTTDDDDDDARKSLSKCNETTTKHGATDTESKIKFLSISSTCSLHNSAIN